MKESVLQSKALNYLKNRGHYAVKIVLATRSAEPDVIACIKGRFVAFEFKSDKGKASPLQEHKLRLIEKAGGDAWVVRDYNDFKEIVLSLEGAA